MKFWKIVNEAAEQAELLLYGEISNSTWWGDEITPRDFKADLDALSGKDVLVRINSMGGDVFAAQAIYNMLKTYKGKVTVMVDGLAASAATIVMMAGEIVTVPSNAMVMIHNPLTALCGYYNAADLQKLGAVLSTVKGSIINAYLTKTEDKCDKSTVAKLMDEETWLTADEAVKYGFADYVGEEIVDMALNGSALIVNSLKFDKVPNLQGLRNHIKVPKEIENKLKNKEDVKMYKTVDELKKDCPDLCKQIEDSAVVQALETEKARISALDALDVEDNPTVHAMVTSAKAKGLTAESIKDFVTIAKDNAPTLVDVVPESTTKPEEFIKNQIAGNKASGVEGVKSAPQDINSNAAEMEMKAAVGVMVNALKGGRK